VSEMTDSEIEQIYEEWEVNSNFWFNWFRNILFKFFVFI
jgi:hypothetical protein